MNKEEQKDPEFFKLVHEVLCNQYSIALSPGDRITQGGSTYWFDFIDQNHTYFVDILERFDVSDRANFMLESKLKLDYISNLKSAGGKYYILILPNEVSSYDRNFIVSTLQSNRLKIILKARDEILSLKIRQGIEDNSKQPRQATSKRGFKKPVLKKAPEELVEVVPDMYLADARFPKTKGDFSKEFIESGRWVDYSNDSQTATVILNINVGDLLVLKSRLAEAGNGHEVNAVGVVTENPKDGLALKVNWIFRENSDRKAVFTSNEERYGLRPVASKEYISLIRQLDLDALSKDDKQVLFPSWMQKLEEDAETPFPPENRNHKIPFHADNVEEIDRLNREPVAKSLARLINTEIFSKKLDQSFMIHLQGEWGAGKSTFLNLIAANLDTDSPNEPWIVVKFNAWQNQRISPPWWTFIDQVYRQAKKKLSPWQRKVLSFREYWRRFMLYGRGKKVLTLLLVLAFIALLVYFFGKSIALFSGSEAASGKTAKQTTETIRLEDLAKLVTSVGAMIGLFYSLSAFIATPFFMRNSGEAKTFLEKSGDPMGTIKRHFEKLVCDIQRYDRKVAVFIDDLDRCNRAYTIELLEGIQTLFKDKGVLYIVAADKDWITTCFEKNYAEFADTVSSEHQKLGELFLEKAFQLSVRMPEISEESRRKYWYHILGISETGEAEQPMDAQKKQEVKTALATAGREKMSDPAYLSGLETEYRVNEAAISDMVLEMLDENQDEVRHLMENHHTLIDPNPRAIKRLANEYTMYRNTLISERRNFDNDILFRWLIFENKCPKLTRLFKKDQKKYAEAFGLLTDDNPVRQLVLDDANLHGGPMTVENIEAIT